MKGLNNFNHGVGQNAYHLVWKPKYAKDPFKFDLVRKDCEQFLREIAQQYSFEVYELQVMPDHIHLFVKCSPVDSPHWVVQQFKGLTSRILRQEFKALKTRIPTLWTRSYYCESCGHISEATVKKYIEDQKLV